MRVERLPFTVYDIIGYLFPGLILLVGIIFLGEFLNVISVISLIDNFGTKLTVLAGLFLLVSAYALGHVISLVGSLTIEKLITTSVGYPSQYLLPNQKTEYASEGSDANGRIKHAVNSICIKNSSNSSVKLVRFCFFPLYFLIRILNFFGLFVHLVKQIDKRPKVIFDNRFSSAFGAARDTLEGKEWFSLVESSIWHHSPGGAARMYNYLTIYGFCRNLSLVNYGFFILAFISFLFFPIEYSADAANSPLPISISIIAVNQFWTLLMLWLTALFLSAVLMFGFLKFYRRYSYEAIYNFIVIDRDAINSISERLDHPKPALVELYSAIKKDLSS
jgi:hypothetical protein